MARTNRSSAGRNVLLLAALLGLLLNVGIVLDAEVFHWILKAARAEEIERPAEELESLERLRQSIVFVAADACADGNAAPSSGTGFVVASGQVITAAHVIEAAEACGASVRVVDSGGGSSAAEIVGLSVRDDLALLRVVGSALPAVMLADSTAYEREPDLVSVLTLGYPLPGEGSDPGEAAISGDGNLSRFDPQTQRFLISGINFNPGNSGGPVLIKGEWTVLGVAVASIDPDAADGLGIVVPAATVRRFYREETGEEIAP